MVFSGSFIEGIRDLVSGTATLLGYGYENVKEIFTDIGLKPPLLLVGSEAAFDTISEVTQDRTSEIMKEIPWFPKEFDEDLRKRMEAEGISEDELPFS